MAEALANGLLKWKRLWHVLYLASKGRIDRSAGSVLCNRAYLCFADVPVEICSVECSADALVKRAPRWLFFALLAIGFRRAELEDQAKLVPNSFNEDAKTVLLRNVREDPLGPLMVLQYDDLHWPPDQVFLFERAKDFVNKMRCWMNHARAQAGVVSATLKGFEFTRTSSPSASRFRRLKRFELFTNLRKQAMPEKTRSASAADRARRVAYAEGVILFAFKWTSSISRYARLFSGACAVEGASLERVAFEKALLRRRMRLLRWVDEAEPGIVPLVFPTHFRENKQACEAVTGPRALIEFDLG